MPQVYNDPNEMRGYGGGHWIGCDCDRCRAIHAEHTRRFGTGCDCPVCKWRRNQKITLERERQQKMAAVNVCDRCETLVKGGALGMLIVETSPEASRTERDICPGCVKDFLKWYDNYDSATSERPRAYSKPFVPKSDEPDPAETFADKVAERLANRKELGSGVQDVPRNTPRTVTREDSAAWDSEDEDG